MTRMKRTILSLMLLVAVHVATTQACVKRDSLPQLVGYVMDSTQALLPHAEISIEGLRLTTSWDGRFIVPAGEWKQNASIEVRCEGYDKQKVALSDFRANEPLMIVLKGHPRKERPSVGGGHGKKVGGELYYTSRALGATAEYATADYAVAAVVENKMAGKPAPNPMPVYAEAEDVTAGKLTAGEVNDFTKWQLWPSILDSTHKAYVKDWRLEARERYTVQVTNRHGYPIVNYPVSLTDRNGNTVYQAVTDNTGKAELWNGLVGKRADVQQDAWTNIILDEPCQASDEVDVLFVFDATGSMGDELRYLREEMKDVIARAKEATGGLSIRTGAVVYRDHGDEYLTRISRLTEDIATTQSFIDRQEANGGGDYPEAIPEALMAALNSGGWSDQARARIAFLILDAPCHEDSATIALLHDQILNAAALGVRIVPVVCSGLDESGELLMRSIALATNGTSFFLTDDSGIGHTHLKPTTDSLKVEHLNDMLVRTIVEFSMIPNCEGHWNDEVDNIEEAFVPNPFEKKDLTQDEIAAKDSPTTLYLLDISGKLIYVYEGRLEEAGDSQLSHLPIPMLSTGVYFVKAFYDGEWHTRKILVH